MSVRRRHGQERWEVKYTAKTEWNVGIKLTRRGEEKENDRGAYTGREGKREDVGCIEAIERKRTEEGVTVRN